MTATLVPEAFGRRNVETTIRESCTSVIRQALGIYGTTVPLYTLLLPHSITHRVHHVFHTRLYGFRIRRGYTATVEIQHAR